ncbi:polyribonucleotide nucleotidyltransferase, partial [bacterium]|nr:polyribonucleotide nucleotidyltransferase [bacterium]
HREIKKLVAIQEELKNLCGKPTRDVTLITLDKEIYSAVKAIVAPAIKDAVLVKGKHNRKNALNALQDQVIEKLSEQFEDKKEQISEAFAKIEKETVRSLILTEKLRADGRGPKDIRSITCDVGFLPRTHGSALFTRGETQALVSITLGNPSEGQRLETLSGEEVKNFMLHYSFPPFSVGECKPVRGPGRREIGHGILAERALTAVLPTADVFPYVIRVNSDILESNGSSSMASVCGGSLALMDAGVPIKSPVAGIAMGLVSGENALVVISDILGSEDACGDMDFKVAGTKDGVTAFQLDLKVDGITREIFKDALYQAREGRLHILNVMAHTLAQPRNELSAYAPSILSFEIDQSKIGLVIGPGGKNIKKIIEDYQVSIDINDDGIVTVSSVNQSGVNEAANYIKLLTAEVEVGETYTGTVKNLVDFGAFVEILPGKEGLIHISRLSPTRINHPSDVLSIGDQISVRVYEIDDRDRINLELLIDGKPIERAERSERTERTPREGSQNSHGGHHSSRGSKPHSQRSGFPIRNDKRSKPYN